MLSGVDIPEVVGTLEGERENTLLTLSLALENDSGGILIGIQRSQVVIVVMRSISHSSQDVKIN